MNSRNQKLRILFVVHGYPPLSRGGVENHTRSLAESLAGRGHEVTVFFPLYDGSPGGPLRVQESGGLRLAGFTGGTRNFFEHLRHEAAEEAFEELLRGGRFHAVHFQHTYHGLPMSLPALAAGHAPLVVMALHDFWYLCPRAHLYLQEENRLCSGPDEAQCACCLLRRLGIDGGNAEREMRAFLRRRREAAAEALSAAHIVTAPSRFLLRGHAGVLQGHGRAEVRRLGVERQALQEAEKGGGGGPRFVYLGAVNRLKNLRVLLEGFRSAAGEASLAVYGRRDDRNESLRLDRAVRLDPRISYHGPYDRGDLARILPGADAGVLPSLMESYSMTAGEFLSAGVPVLASNRGGLPEMVENGVDGLLFDPEDSAGLARMLQRIIDEPKVLSGLEPDRERVRSVDDEVDEWERSYAEGAA